MSTSKQNNAEPLVSSPTRAESTNIETIVGRLRSERIIIPDYQRDADQWDLRKESLFIESLINNLTIPAFFFAETLNSKIEVVDGQQRLSTILKYANDDFAISDDEGINYLAPQNILYRGKRFSQLPEKFKNVFNDYPLSIIYLPKDLDLSTKLEIFRRINEGGTPLTAQDIRLSYYSTSSSVFFIRLAGICTNSAAANRIILSAMDKDIANPWDDHSHAWEVWTEWWRDKKLAKGQIPSEMFLWYLIFLYRNNMDNLLSNQEGTKHLLITSHGSTEEALDIFCAQLHYTDLKGGEIIFPTYKHGLVQCFNIYIQWMEFILARFPGLSVDKYKQMALLIGATTELNIQPELLSHDALDAIGSFLRTPRQAGAKWLPPEGYPEQRGSWTGKKGQKAQCDSVTKLLLKIIDTYPNENAS